MPKGLRIVFKQSNEIVMERERENVDLCRVDLCLPIVHLIKTDFFSNRQLYGGVCVTFIYKEKY